MPTEASNRARPWVAQDDGAKAVSVKGQSSSEYAPTFTI